GGGGGGGGGGGRAGARAGPAYAAWYAHLTKLWRDFGSLPIRFARDFNEARDRGIAVAGTADRVREELETQVAASGCTYLVCRLLLGKKKEAEATASIDRFVADGMPYLVQLPPR